MPEFADVASHFDNESAYDAYTGVFLFKAQLNTFIETAVIGSTERRRTMSVRPGTAMPPRGAVSTSGETWLLGNGNTDSFFDTRVRTAYWLKFANHQATLTTPGAFLSGQAGTPVFVSMEYEKDTVDSLTTSGYDTFWRAFFAASESVPKGTLLVIGNKIHRARVSHIDLGGFLMAQCDELAEPGLVSMKVPDNKVYDPITDTYVGGDTVLPAIVFEMYKLYKYDTKADPKMASGDLAALVPQPIKVGSVVEFLSTRYRVAAQQPELDAYAVHLVRT